MGIHVAPSSTAFRVKQPYGESDRAATALDFQSVAKIWPPDLDDTDSLARLDACLDETRRSLSKGERIAIKGIHFQDHTDILEVRYALLVMMAFKPFRAAFTSCFGDLISDLFANLAERNAEDDLRQYKPSGLLSQTARPAFV